MDVEFYTTKPIPMKKPILSALFIFAAYTSISAQVINEIRIDQPGSDNDEYFEISAPSGTDLTGLFYLVIGDGAGGSGVVEHVTDLSGQTVPADGFFFAAEASFTLGGAVADMTTTLNFENSDNVSHLLVDSFTGSQGDDLDTNDDGILDLSPWASILDCISLVEATVPPAGGEFPYCTTILGPDGPFVPSHSYRLPNGLMAWNIGQFDPADPVANDTPGASNVAPLPVELLSFTATTVDYAIELSWRTASESNNSGFAIEMSESTNLGEADWTEMGFVSGQGNSTEQNDYSYRVNGIDAGSYQFRLKQIDFDGSFQFSPTVLASIETPNAIDLEEAYPNPFNPSTSFSFVLAEEQVVRIVVLDHLGRQVATLQEGTVPAQVRQVVRFESGNLPSGMYLIHLSGNQSLATFSVNLVK